MSSQLFTSTFEEMPPISPYKVNQITCKKESSKAQHSVDFNMGSVMTSDMPFDHYFDQKMSKKECPKFDGNVHSNFEYTPRVDPGGGFMRQENPVPTTSMWVPGGGIMDAVEVLEKALSPTREYGMNAHDEDSFRPHSPPLIPAVIIGNNRLCLDDTPPKPTGLTLDDTIPLSQPTFPELASVVDSPTADAANTNREDFEHRNIEINEETQARLDQTIAILDWDDTLLPSSQLDKMGYRIDKDDEIFSDKLSAQLNEIEGMVKHLIEEMIATYKETVIITNAEERWVEMSAKKFIPGVLPVLKKCRIISARSTFEVNHSGPYEWKTLAFYHVIARSFGILIRPPTLDEDSSYTVYLQGLYRIHKDKSKGKSLKDILDETDDGSREMPFESEKDIVDLTYESDGHAEESDLPPPRAMLSDEQDMLQEKRKDDESVSYDSSNEIPTLHETDTETSDQNSDPETYDTDEIVNSWYDHLEYEKLGLELHEDHEHIAKNVKKVILSLGDSIAEKAAANAVAKQMKNTDVKTIKFLDKPTIEEVIKQLKLVNENIQYFGGMEGAFDLALDVDPEGCEELGTD